MSEKPVYKVSRLAAPPRLDARWKKDTWQDVPALTIENHMGGRPEHFPRVQARVGYHDDDIYLIFLVQDRYVRAVHLDPQGAVCRDSCVEFFFTPGQDTGAGYFNLEANCGGNMLFHFQTRPRRDAVCVSPRHCAEITIAHSLPRRVEPEITEAVEWSLEYRIPCGMLKAYSDPVLPRTGARWRANFYKCGDDTSHPHWLTWSPVDRPKPDFHVPESFGILEFA